LLDADYSRKPATHYHQFDFDFILLELFHAHLALAEPLFIRLPNTQSQYFTMLLDASVHSARELSPLIASSRL